LSSGEVRYIEDLARENRDLQEQLAGLRLRRDAMRLRVTDSQTRSSLVPLLANEYQVLNDDLIAAGTSLSAALEDRRKLESEYDFLVQQSAPPTILSPRPYVPQSVAITDAGTIAAGGLMLSLFFMGVVVMTVERVDRRVLGARSVVAIHGELPLAEIPIIPIPSVVEAS
jgi:uncharacterized protein involved in exopolysaccharide biosynthesis